VLVWLVQHVLLVLEGHRVAEAGASPTDYRNAQSRRFRLLRTQDLSYLRNCPFRQLDHFQFLLCFIIQENYFKSDSRRSGSVKKVPSTSFRMRTSPMSILLSGGLV